jgi:lysophospholipase L1-like esterase
LQTLVFGISAVKMKVSKVTTDKILLFGDSITEQSYNQEYGFNLSPALQQEYFRKLQIVARGYGGYNTEHARWILKPTLEAEAAGGSRIRLLIVFFGTNDSAQNAQQHVSLERYAENLRCLATEALEHKVPIILVGPAPVDEHKMNGDRATLTNLAYSNAAGKVAKECSSPFIDLWHGFLASKGWKEGDPIPGKLGENTNQTLDDLLTDGVHFSGKAYRVWYDLLLETIRREHPDLRTENLPTVLPGIADIDNSDLPASLWQDVKVASQGTL